MRYSRNDESNKEYAVESSAALDLSQADGAAPSTPFSKQLNLIHSQLQDGSINFDL